MQGFRLFDEYCRRRGLDPDAERLKLEARQHLRDLEAKYSLLPFKPKHDAPPPPAPPPVPPRHDAARMAKELIAAIRNDPQLQTALVDALFDDLVQVVMGINEGVHG